MCKYNFQSNNMFEKGGLGLQNSRNRLELLFNNDFLLDVNQGDQVFKIELEIPLA